PIGSGPGVAMWSRLLVLALLLLPAQALAGTKDDVAALAPSGLVLVMDAGGNELVAQNTDEPFVPASVTKIVTAWLAMAVLGGDEVRSAEEQTPITPLAIAQFRLRGPPDGSGRISLSQDPAVSLQYAGELIAAFIERAGGSVKGEISTGAVPVGLEPAYVH